MGLNPRQERFAAAYAGEANGVAADAALIAGYAHPSQYATQLLARADIRERIEAYRAENRAAVRARGIAAKERRLAVYNEIHERLWRIVEERAAAFAASGDGEGGASGFIARTYKIAANGRTVEELRVDAALIAAIENNLKQMAQEMGEWDEEKPPAGDGLVRRYIGVNVQVVLGADADR